jgi:hypothetical protein
LTTTAMDVLGVAKFRDNLVVWNMKGKKNHAQGVRTQPYLANLMITKKKKTRTPDRQRTERYKVVTVVRIHY